MCRPIDTFELALAGADADDVIANVRGIDTLLRHFKSPFVPFQWALFGPHQYDIPPEVTRKLKVNTMATETVRTHVVIPRDLVEAVDQLVGQRKRSAFFVEAVEEKLEREQFGRALAETKGSLRADAYPEWSTPEKTSAWVRELRSLDRKPIDHNLTRDE
jgi:hypothetical protein